ncbi:MAG: hypothetical protein KatS3mg076_1650 [Candidatus Binatia bacterium]|nr:MAG: hypothetical protein KatS3mg076_1650 [Candidatus Binatia bacterium]
MWRTLSVAAAAKMPPSHCEGQSAEPFAVFVSSGQFHVTPDSVQSTPSLWTSTVLPLPQFVADSTKSSSVAETSASEPTAAAICRLIETDERAVHARAADDERRGRAFVDVGRAFTEVRIRDGRKRRRLRRSGSRREEQTQDEPELRRPPDLRLSPLFRGHGTPSLRLIPRHRTGSSRDEKRAREPLAFRSFPNPGNSPRVRRPARIPPRAPGRRREAGPFRISPWPRRGSRR